MNNRIGNACFAAIRRRLWPLGVLTVLGFSGCPPVSPDSSSPSAEEGGAAGPAAAEPAGAATTWQDVTYPDRGFSVSLPGQPETRTSGESWTLSVILPDRKQSCTITVASGDPVQAGSMEEWWKKYTPSTTAGFSQYTQALNLTTEEISLNGHPGREFNYKQKGAPGVAPFWPCRRRAYYVNGSAYILTWKGPEGGISSSEMEKFFGSFQLTESGPGAG